MDYKLKIIFNRRKTASDTRRGSVEIEVSGGSERRRFSTGVSVLLHQWRDGMVVNHPECVALNLRIQDRYRELSGMVGNCRGGLSGLGAAMMSGCSFPDWMEAQIEGRGDLAGQTLRQHRTMLARVREFGRFERFSDLTVENVMMWDAEIRRHVRKQSAVHDYHKRLKVYVNRAVASGLLDVSPYRGFKVSRGRECGVKYLTDAERERIEGLELSGTMAVARDMFLLACYTGLAYCDLVRVRRDEIVSEGGREFICDRRQKTRGGYRLLVMPKAKAILERYDYRMDRLSNQKCNLFLKAIAAMAGIRGNLTFHMGRHTFATWALKHGVSIEVVSKMLAHGDISTTQIYARVLQDEVTAGFERLIELED